MEHSVIVAIYHMLHRGQPYHDLGADYFTHRDSPTARPPITSELRELGCQTIAEPPAG